MIWTASELSILKLGYQDKLSDREIAQSLVAHGHAFRTSNAIMKMRNVLGLRRNTGIHNGKGRPLKVPYVELKEPPYWAQVRANDAKWDAAMAAEGITKRFTVTEPGTKAPIVMRPAVMARSANGYTYPVACE